MSMTVDTTGWPISGYWGAPARFIAVTPPGGTALNIAVVAYTDGAISIGVGPATGNALLAVGKVRNVVVDGVIVNTI